MVIKEPNNIQYLNKHNLLLSNITHALNRDNTQQSENQHETKNERLVVGS
jgi:hypothetical protein